MDNDTVAAREWQFDGLVGPTHNYAGLAFGNVAAQTNAGAVSNPKAAALQGLEKMRFVRDLGIPQAFLPPHPRPLVSILTQLGFKGKPSRVIEQVAKAEPALLASVFSSSFMWTANAATITPSCDSGDGKLHLTPSNMTSHFHRNIESEFGFHSLNKIFHNKEYFCVNKNLFSNNILGDEGAANHMVSCEKHGSTGTHFYVYGDAAEGETLPKKFPARQKRLASESIARAHGVNSESLMYLQQAPQAIDQGVFHNDVIAMNTTRQMIVHEEAFIPAHQQTLREFTKKTPYLSYREIQATELTVAEAVQTYFFNSQLLDLGKGRFAIIAPGECENHPSASRLLSQLQEEQCISEVHYKDLRESMRNGGGPACLRLRVVMTDLEASKIHQGIILTDERYHALREWVSTHYRDCFQASDFCDPDLLGELERAYLALEEICDLPGLYQDYLPLS